jgi:DNA-binding GntR family transcriptional regulator
VKSDILHFTAPLGATATSTHRWRLDVPNELKSAKFWAVEQIRGLIYSGELQPDQKVLIESLSQRFGISRTPVRDALWQLAGEGLVTISPRVGAFVRRISRRETEDIYAIKLAVEPTMASWATQRAGRSARAEYRTQLSALSDAADRGDVAHYVQVLEERRDALLLLADSPPMADVLKVIDGRVRLLRFRNLRQPGRLAVSIGHHIAIADAIAAGDAEAAANAMHKHMANSANAIRTLLDRDEAEDTADATEAVS